jgi:hypothetical protein
MLIFITGFNICAYFLFPDHTRSCLKGIEEWEVRREERVFKARLGVNRTIKNGFGIIRITTIEYYETGKRRF